ncbi:MAG: hypothetical protein KDC87_19170 [Planctomycetes bacterium]|nr:hypothetical protein [Planctomycetota bacterium]MCB9870394.1 hypothetical protein [Planctomycetota bacterium]MCB9889385.1 hypothetical protein [Planctomycetota bacterium]
MSQTATIHIKLGTVELTCTGPIDREQLADVLHTLRREVPECVAAPPADASPSAAELLAASAAKTFGEKAGVIAYWLEQFRGRRDWRSGDIVDVLRDLDEPAPANITDALNQKLKKGLFEVDDRRWKLTGEGRGWVRYGLLGRDHADPDES